jgi:hypothetical protein
MNREIDNGWINQEGWKDVEQFPGGCGDGGTKV